MSRNRAHTKQSEPQEVGVDGYPIRSREEEERERRVWQYSRALAHKRHLGFLRRVVCDQNYFPAVMDALQYCESYRLPLPDWLSQTLRALLSHMYQTNSRMRKRAEAMTAKRKLHMRRYAEIDELRTHGVKWDSKKEDADIFEIASTFLGEKPDTIRASYKKVRKSRPEETYVAEWRPPIGVKKGREKR